MTTSPTTTTPNLRELGLTEFAGKFSQGAWRLVVGDGRVQGVGIDPDPERAFLAALLHYATRLRGLAD